MYISTYYLGTFRGYGEGVCPGKTPQGPAQLQLQYEARGTTNQSSYDEGAPLKIKLGFSI